ncbi:hypothetical protein BGZ46_002179 [Entomortierella lignicola]|nr:hypothetical protein BGZ46_002179 [Entomortierella lignicola]
MYLQQHQQQQWALEQQQNQQMQMQHQTLAQNIPFPQHSSRKRGFECEEGQSYKKRNLGSELSAQGFYSDAMPDSPGSIRSNMSADLGSYQGGAGYFDQSHFSGSSSLGTSPHGTGVQYTASTSGGASAPTTPAGIHITSSSPSISSSSAFGAMPSSLPRSWNSFSQGGSYSSPPTPAASIFSSAFAAKDLQQQPLEYRLLQEQQTLHQAQLAEQQRLQMTQQHELLEMQRHQEEQAKVAALARQQQQQTPVHDHNDPATWGYDDASAGRFSGYLGGNGKGYTPAAIGGVAALAAMAAANRESYGGRNNGMDMDV